MKAPRRSAPWYLAWVLAGAAVALAGCAARSTWLESLKAVEGGEGTRSSLEQLKRDIDRFQAEVDRTVSAAQNLGVYWKMLALKYVDNGMYGLALEALDEAVAVYPENPILFHYMGLSAARAAKGVVADGAERARLFARAEAAYRRAIFLEPGYVDALYGLAVLLSLELDRSPEAEPLLAAVLAREPKNVDALFLLGRIAYAEGRYEDAVDAFDRILATKPPERVGAQAEANRQQAKEALYGAP